MRSRKTHHSLCLDQVIVRARVRPKKTLFPNSVMSPTLMASKCIASMPPIPDHLPEAEAAHPGELGGEEEGELEGEGELEEEVEGEAEEEAGEGVDSREVTHSQVHGIGYSI